MSNVNILSRWLCIKVSFEAQEFHIENEGGVGGDDPGVALLTVGVVGGAGQLGAFAH